MAELGRAAEFHCPALPPDPAVALRELDVLVTRASAGPVALIGSSLGGYYATVLSERHGLPAALLNPAVRPYALLQQHLGMQTNLYTGERYEFTTQHVEALRAMEVAAITPQRYLLVVTTGDDVLDYRDAVALYRGCRQIVIDGGDHGMGEFAAQLDTVLAFCGVAP